MPLLARSSFAFWLLLGLAGSLALPDLHPVQAQEIEVQESKTQAVEQAAPEATDPTNLSQESAVTEATPQPPLTLERPASDPLIPGKARKLSPSEQAQLRLDLERLNQDAEATYEQGDRAQAYRQFFRLLSLSQYLPIREELASLSRVGRRTWQDNQAEATQLITNRIRTLALESGEKRSPLQRQALAEAYESLGAWQLAIAQYEGLLALEQPDGSKGTTPNDLTSPLAESTLVNRLAQLSLFTLNYPAAALYTEQALQLSTEEALADATSPSPSAPPADALANPPSDDASLALPSATTSARTSLQLKRQLAYIYEQNQQFAEAASTQQQLYPLYAAPAFVNQQPALQVAIARNQARAGQLVDAIATYQAAYAQSQTQQQFDVSSQALSQLASLYRDQAQFTDALSVYNILLEVHELSYNLYGIIDTHQNRAEIFRQQQQVEPARQAYRQAIHAARLLGYREAELQQQLDALAETSQ